MEPKRNLKIKEAIILVIAAIPFFYLSSTFIAFSFNPALWWVWIRFMFIILVIAWIFLILDKLE
jgi:hypothetical protein